MNEELMHRVLRLRWVVFSAFGAAYVLVFFNQMSVAVVANDIMQDLNCNATTIGVMASIYFYVYAAMQIPAGLLCDSVGSRKTVSFSLGIAAFGALIFGFAPTVSVAMIGRGLVGLGVSAVFIAIMKIVAEWFSIREFAKMQGIITALGGLGVLLGTFGLGWLAKAFGWRIIFETIGITTGLLVFGGLWAGPYFMDVYGLTKPQAGAVLSMIACTMIVGSPLMASVSDNIFQSRKKNMIFCTACLCALFSFLWLNPSGLPIPALYGVIIFFTSFSACTMVVAFTTLKELYPVQIAGTSVAIGNFFPFFGGAVFMAILGNILDEFGSTPDGAYSVTGYTMVFAFLTGSAVLQFICALFLKETFPKEVFEKARAAKKAQKKALTTT